MLGALGRKTLIFFNAFSPPDNGNYHFVRRYVTSLRWLSFGPLVLFAAGAVGTVLTARRKWRVLLPVYVVGLAFAVSIILIFVAGRYKLPFLAILAVMAGGAVSPVINAARAQRWGTPAAAVVLFAVAAAIFWPRNYTGQPQPGFPLSPNEFLIHGARFYELERMEEAVALFEDGRRLFPRHPDFPASLAAVDLAEGRNDAALERIEQALQLRSLALLSGQDSDAKT